MNYSKFISTMAFTLIILSMSCGPGKEQILREKTDAYFEAWNHQEFTLPAFADFKLDTSRVWHGKKVGDGKISVFNPNSGWKQWDKAWNGTYSYEITLIDLEELSVTGEFRETTDFLKYIGMPEGFSATVTFWFDEQLRVKETQYDWFEGNRSMHDLIKPIVAWAKVNDSVRINKIYLNNGFVPSEENAREWKALFERYEEANQ